MFLLIIILSVYVSFELPCDDWCEEKNRVKLTTIGAKLSIFLTKQVDNHCCLFISTLERFIFYHYYIHSFIKSHM